MFLVYKTLDNNPDIIPGKIHLYWKLTWWILTKPMMGQYCHHQTRETPRVGG
ncbi:hypothetical protein J6590_103042 [Homalodisca vitripennis]|nr:hypothetical protein J6590_103042 [Homalodisca vitripennis]